MRKRTYFLIGILLIGVVTLLLSIFSNNLVKGRLSGSLEEQYSQQEKSVAEEASSALLSEVRSVEEKLKLIAAVPEIRSGDTNSCNKKLLEASNTLKASLGNLGRVNKEGKFQCSLNPKLIGIKASTLGSYIDDIFTDPEHKTVMSRVILPPGSSSYVIAVHVPVFDESHTFSGTLGGAINLDSLKEKYLSKVSLLETGTPFVVDDDGTFLYRVEKELIGKNINSEVVKKFVIKNPDVFNQIIASSKQGNSGVIKYNFNNIDKIVAYAPVNIFPDRKWAVAVTLPVAEIKSIVQATGLDSTFNYILAFAVVSILFILGSLYIFSIRMVFSPIEKIADAARKLGEGDFGSRVNINGKDEIGRLAQSFNDMGSKLQESYKNLEEKIKQRTRQLNSTLQESETQSKFLDTLLKNLPIGVLLAKAPKGEPVMVNPKGIELLGRGIDPSYGKVDYSKTYNILNEDGTPYQASEFPLSKALTEGESFTKSDIFIQKPDGTKIAIRAISAPIKDSDGKTVSAIVVFEDITKEHELDKVKDEFVNLASHQLRTPASGVKAFVSMLLDGDAGKLNKQQREFLEKVYYSNERELHLIDDLLNVARLDSGRLAVEKKKTNISELLDFTIEELKAEIEKRKQKIVFKKSQDTIEVLTDPEKLQMVLGNLIDNASKYTKEKGKIEISMQNKDKSVLISIKDSGVGVAKADLPKLFKKFARVDNELSVHVGGTGLGLYMVKKIIDLLGGTVTVESEVGKGTKFSIELNK